MFLTFWDNVREAFINIFTHITLGNIISLLIGVILGLLISLLIYVISLTNNLKKDEKKNKFDKTNLSEEDNEANALKINEYINNSISRYDDIKDNRKMNELLDEVKDIISNLIIDIAKVYYPSSPHPLAELSIDEMLLLDKYIVSKVDEIFDHKGLRKLKNKNLSVYLGYYDKYTKIKENKYVKEAKKYHVGEVASILTNIKNAINIGGFFSKGIRKLTLNIAIDKIVKTIILIVGNETAKVYSKNVFVADDTEISKEISEASEIVDESDEI